MSFSGLILTNSGRNELAKAEMGEKFCITDIVFGDGQYNGTRTDIKELVNPIMSLPVTKIERDKQNEGSVRVECDFNSADISKAFFWREIGIIANGKLCYYDNSREDAEYIDPESETIIKQKRMRFILLISSDIEVNVTVGSALYALDEDMQSVLFPQYEEAAELESLKSGEGIFKAFGKIAKAISGLINHIGNKSNPHGVTKTQVGLGNVPNVSTNDQTVTYTAATALAVLTSGEKLSVAFGKIAKSISTLISHINTKATTSVLGHVKVTDSNAVTDSTGLALAATEKNAAIPGTLAYKIAEQNTNLSNFIKHNYISLPVVTIEGNSYKDVKYSFSVPDGYKILTACVGNSGSQFIYPFGVQWSKEDGDSTIHFYFQNSYSSQISTAPFVIITLVKNM